MFQPFQGKFVQTVGCFLSKGSASGSVLYKIILEGLALAEKAGLFVDAIVTDGASWNRAMWKMFGVTEDRISVQHPCDEKRRLWFMSDYPHLAKILRNFVTKFQKYDVIYTPDGPISKKHWYALLEVLNAESYNLKVNFKLRKEHIDPKYYQKMNVALALEFFNVFDALELLENRHEDLEDCAGTKACCKPITGLNKAMNSRTPGEALSPGNSAWNIIENFIKYLKEWEKTAKEWEKTAKENNYEFLTENCYYGLKVSLKAALEICQFLVSNCGFTYVMTGRFNQDCVERYFGMMRESCGANDHPDSILFIQMYKLISTYSLIKPPKVCNVEGSEILHALLSLKNVQDTSERQQHWEGIVDTILDKGNGSHLLGEASHILIEHDYTMSETSEYALSYIAGYVSRKAASWFAKYVVNKKLTACSDCFSCLLLSPNDVVPERHKLIQLKSRGNLINPSLQLYDLIFVLERATMETVKEGEINGNSLFEITRALEELSPIPFVGCVEHAPLLTRRILVFYLTMRMLFICKQFNKNHNQAREGSREKRKSAKLTTEHKNTLVAKDTKRGNCCDSSTVDLKKRSHVNAK